MNTPMPKYQNGFIYNKITNARDYSDGAAEDNHLYVSMKEIRSSLGRLGTLFSFFSNAFKDNDEFLYYFTFGMYDDKKHHKQVEIKHFKK